MLTWIVDEIRNGIVNNLEHGGPIEKQNLIDHVDSIKDRLERLESNLEMEWWEFNAPNKRDKRTVEREEVSQIFALLHEAGFSF